MSEKSTAGGAKKSADEKAGQAKAAKSNAVEATAAKPGGRFSNLLGAVKKGLSLRGRSKKTLVWWGVFLVALGAPYGYWSIYGPMVITLLLLRVSGVALLDKYQVQRKPEYAEYIKATSAFIPWFPRSARR